MKNVSLKLYKLLHYIYYALKGIYYHFLPVKMFTIVLYFYIHFKYPLIIVVL